MSFPLSRLATASLAIVTLAGCASGGGGSDPDAPAPELTGAYRFETQLNFSRGAEEIAGVITFQDESFLTFVSDFERTNVPAPCRYFVRGPRIQSECEGYEFTFREMDDGRIRLDIVRDGGRRQGIGRGMAFLAGS